jgi:hypothetical protein
VSEPDRFDLACPLLPGPDRFFAQGPPRPIGGVRPMGGLLNRIRRFVDDGAPVVAGFHAVGDAHTCTNPLYGRGCSLALVQAGLLADAVAAHPDDPVARAAAYEAACAVEVEPWFEVSVQMDRMGADPNGLGAAGAGGDGGDGPGRAMAAVMVAAQTDPVLGRAMARFWNLLCTPVELASDPEVMARMAEVMADPDAWPLPPREGPTREELLEALVGDREEASA